MLLEAQDKTVCKMKQKSKHQQEVTQQADQSNKKEITKKSMTNSSASFPVFDPVKFNQVASARHIKFNQIIREYTETSEI